MDLEIHILTPPGDNYIYVCRYGQSKAFVVDPGRADTVSACLRQHRLRLTHILLTHHHGDHIYGVPDLKRQTGCKVIGSDPIQIPLIDISVSGGQQIALDKLSIAVIATPGHTQSSVCYFMPIQPCNPIPRVWTGDTLFVGGCGRIFECDPTTMYRSLHSLAALPDETEVYCGHEYSIENFRFASALCPDQIVYRDRLKEVESLVRSHCSAVPSTIAREKQTNIFLRADSVEQFAHLRGLKDHF